MGANRLTRDVVVVDRDDLAVLVAALEHSYLRPSMAGIYDRMAAAAQEPPAERLAMVNTGLGMGLLPSDSGPYVKVGGA